MRDSPAQDKSNGGKGRMVRERNAHFLEGGEEQETVNSTALSFFPPPSLQLRPRVLLLNYDVHLIEM